MKINNLVFNYRNFYKPNTQRKTNFIQQKDCFTPSFQTRSLKQVARRISEEKFPSKACYDYSIEQSSENNQISTYEMHTKFYAPLLDCNTLDEAKALFPEEFKDTIEATELDPKQFRNTMKRIKSGKYENLSIENLTLELIKLYYAKAEALEHNNETYFDISYDTLPKLFKALNIKKFSQSYAQSIQQSKPKNSSAHSAAAANYYKNHPEAKQRPHTEKQKNYFANNPEAKVELSNSLKRHYENNPLYQEALKEAYKRHPEFTEVKSEVAKSMPKIFRIFEKIKNKEPLTKEEKIIYLTYYKAVNKRIPGHIQVIMQEYSKIIDEWGIRKGKKPNSSN